MLELKNIYVTFEKTIFENASFQAFENETTIIIGESGSGKTTLFDCILGKYANDCEYKFNEMHINECSLQEKEEYILHHISYASQQPTFIADLKMKDQIELLQKIYQTNEDIEELVHLFELDELMNCYPNQCSGGEKSRFAFILSLIKKADIYLFDEPTSALDDFQTEHILEILEKLKRKGKIVLISTHDHRLIERGDRVIEIKNNELHVVKEKEITEKCIKEKNSLSIKYEGLRKYWKLIPKHHRVYSFFMKGTLSLGVAIALMGIEFGYLVNQRFDDALTQSSSNVILINKLNYENQLFQNEPSSSLPITDDEMKLIENIDHISSIQDYTVLQTHQMSVIRKDEDINSDGTHFEIEEWDAFDDNTKITLILNNKMKELMNEENENMFAGVIGGLNTTIYPDGVNFNDRIEMKINEEGLIVSHAFYKKNILPFISNESDLKDLIIKFPVFVPIYNAPGSHIFEGQCVNDGYLETCTYANAKGNSYVGKIVYQEYKLKGVLFDSSIFKEPDEEKNTIVSDAITFALPHSEFRRLVEANKTNKTHTCIYTEKYEQYCDVELDNLEYEKITRTVDYIPYSPTALSIVVDNLKYVGTVRQQLKNLGFATYNQFADLNTYQEAQDNVRVMILILTVGTFGLILFMNILLKLNNSKDESSFQQFFREKGFTYKMIQKLNKQRFQYNCLSISIYVLIEYILLNGLLYLITKSVVYADIQNLILFVVLIVITEYVVPLCLEKHYAKGVK